MVNVDILQITDNEITWSTTFMFDADCIHSLVCEQIQLPQYHITQGYLAANPVINLQLAASHLLQTRNHITTWPVLQCKMTILAYAS